jgi:hypothetical protein
VKKFHTLLDTPRLKAMEVAEERKAKKVQRKAEEIVSAWTLPGQPEPEKEQDPHALREAVQGVVFVARLRTALTLAQAAERLSTPKS